MDLVDIQTTHQQTHVNMNKHWVAGVTHLNLSNCSWQDFTGSDAGEGGSRGALRQSPDPLVHSRTAATSSSRGVEFLGNIFECCLNGSLFSETAMSRPAFYSKHALICYTTANWYVWIIVHKHELSVVI